MARKIEKLIISLRLPFYRKAIYNSLKEKWNSFGIESSNICNANCSFCGYGKKMDKREKGFVSFKVLKYALDLYQKTGGGNFSFISILGDPLADKEFLEKIKFVRSYQAVKAIMIYTNLIGLSNFKAEDFIKSGLTDVNISTAIGDNSMFKRLYGVDQYNKTVDNLLTLLRINDSLGRPIKISLLLRIDYDFFNKLNEMSIFKEIRKYMSQNDIRMMAKTSWSDFSGLIKNSDLPKGASLQPNVERKKIPCYGLYRKLQVLKNGDIAACSCRISPDLVIDNIFNYTSLYDYWRGKKLESFRKKWIMGDIPSICKNCNHYMPYTQLVRSMIKNRLYLMTRKIWLKTTSIATGHQALQTMRK